MMKSTMSSKEVLSKFLLRTTLQIILIHLLAIVCLFSVIVETVKIRWKIRLKIFKEAAINSKKKIKVSVNHFHV